MFLVWLGPGVPVGFRRENEKKKERQVGDWMFAEWGLVFSHEIALSHV